MLNIIVTLKCGLEVTEGHWKWYSYLVRPWAVQSLHWWQTCTWSFWNISPGSVKDMSMIFWKFWRGTRLKVSQSILTVLMKQVASSLHTRWNMKALSRSWHFHNSLAEWTIETHTVQEKDSPPSWAQNQCDTYSGGQNWEYIHIYIYITKIIYLFNIHLQRLTCSLSHSTLCLKKWTPTIYMT